MANCKAACSRWCLANGDIGMVCQEVDQLQWSIRGFYLEPPARGQNWRFILNNESQKIWIETAPQLSDVEAGQLKLESQPCW